MILSRSLPSCALLAASCAMAAAPAPPAETAPQTSPVTPEFAWNITARCVGKSTSNWCYSPYSIHRALSLLSLGATGQTQQEILQALGTTTTAEQLGAAHQSTLQAIKASAVDAGTLSLGDGIWTNVRPNKPFIKAAKALYEAEVDSPVNVPKINSWIEKRTLGLITNVLSAPPSDTEMILVNAMAFLGNWEDKFLVAATAPKPFNAPSGKRDVLTMQKLASLPYAQVDGTAMVLLPYKGRKLSMALILPRQGTTIETALKGLSSGDWERFLSASRPEEVDIALPKFQVEWKQTLNSTLTSLGMKKAFLDRAEFSIAQSSLKVSTVLHNAVVRVNEEGTQAAAATAIALPASAPNSAAPPKPFHLDRPFLFAIIDHQTNTILFTGGITQP